MSNDAAKYLTVGSVTTFDPRMAMTAIPYGTAFAPYGQEPEIKWTCGKCSSSFEVPERMVGYCQVCMKMDSPVKPQDAAAALAVVAAELTEKNPQVTRRFMGLIFDDKKK